MPETLFNKSCILKNSGILKIFRQAPEASKKFQVDRNWQITFNVFKKLKIKKETLAQVFSCEFCEISKNTFFREHLRVTASR